MTEAKSEFTIRLATSADAATIAWHRARMWQDMGEVPDHLFESLRARSEAQLTHALADGTYVGWLATTATTDVVIAGAGVHLRDVMPHPLRRGNETIAIAEGRRGTIINVFTEPEWRRRGVATLLLQRIIDWSREVHLDGLVLHASDAGRALYEKMGFVATKEMRLND